MHRPYLPHSLFTNAKPCDYACDEEITATFQDSTLDTPLTFQGEVKSRFPVTGDGFVVLKPHCFDVRWCLKIDIHGSTAGPWSDNVCL